MVPDMVTQAHIEAALEDLRQLIRDYEDVPDATDKNGQAVFERARLAVDKLAALTAAAEVDNKGKCVQAHMGGKRCVGKCMNPKDCCERPLPAAAEVGEQHGPPISEAARLTEYAQCLINERHATIERCTQKMQEMYGRPLSEIIAEIRALKDKT